MLQPLKVPALLLLVGFVATPVQAQNPVSRGGPQAAPAISADPSTADVHGMVDESALRYYAANRQMARMKAEIARLKQLYPGWTEPADLDSLKPSPPEEAPLWDLFTAGRFDDLRAAIAQRGREEPGWQPSEELARKLMRAEFRRQVLSAKLSEDVVALYRRDSGALDPSDVESIWAIADALADSGSSADALSLYRSILESSADSGARRATIQKAIAHLRMAQVEELIAMGRGEVERRAGAATDTPAEFEPIRTDITRAQIAAFLHDDPAGEPSATDLAAFQSFARRVKDPSQTGLLAWYAYKRRQFRDALDWFKLAIASGGDAMVAHGLAHTLRELNQLRDAEDVAFAWRERFVGNEILYIDLLENKLTLPAPPVIEPARIDRYAKVVTASQSGEGAQALGWYAYNSCQFDSALEWFQRAVAWQPSETTVFGYALTLQRLKRQRDYLEVINRYDGLFAKVVNLLFSDEPDGPPLVCQQTAQGPVRLAPTQSAVQPAPTIGRIPKPGSAPAGDTRPVAVARKEFPLAVPMDNPLRYPPASLQRALTQAVAPGSYVKEPAMPAPPLVARRVPGAGPMPYERFGFALLPAYDGNAEPRRLGAPTQGTLWQRLAERNRDTGRAVSEDDRFSAPGRSSGFGSDAQGSMR